MVALELVVIVMCHRFPPIGGEFRTDQPSIALLTSLAIRSAVFLSPASADSLDRKLFPELGLLLGDLSLPLPLLGAPVGLEISEDGPDFVVGELVPEGWHP